MNATCRPFSIATSDASSATTVLPEPTSPCNRRFIGRGSLEVLDDLLERLPLAWRELEHQHAPGRLADAVVDVDRIRLRFAGCRSPSRQDPDLEQERLLENQPTLRGRLEAIEQVDPGAVRRKVGGDQRRAARRQFEPEPDRLGQLIGQILGQPMQCVVHQPALNLGGDAAGPSRTPERCGRYAPSRRPPRPAARTGDWSAGGRRARASRQGRTGRPTARARTHRAETAGSATSPGSIRSRR